MSSWSTQRFQPKIAEPFDQVAPSIESGATKIYIEGILKHLEIWEQQRLSLPQVLSKARWFILWHKPSGDSTPFGFAVMDECPNAIYGYSLWARQSGRIQKIATATDKTMLDIYLQSDRCELTTETVRVRSFLQNIAQKLTSFT